MRMAKLAVLVDRQEADSRRAQGVNVFESYIAELLGQAGVPFVLIDSVEELLQVNPDVAIAAFVREGAASAEALWSYAENGGSLIGLGNLGGLSKKLKCTALSPLKPGYAHLPESWGDERPLRFMKATPWATGSDNEYVAERIGSVSGGVQAQADGPAAVLQFRVGTGTIDRWSVDLVNTVVQLQQGTQPVFEDGIPAPDGSGSLDDGWLKADDETAVDWVADRAATQTGQPYYPHPYADLWREALVGHVIRTALAKGLTLPFLGHWPDGLSGVALISHDSDGNEDEAGLATLELLKECGVQSTWCMIEPGYSPSLYEAIRADGHELGFHYNAIDHPWTREQFLSQFKWLQGAIGSETVISNKNHYTRFEGWGELFRWCEETGIQSDESRGPSKRGNVGVPFATCHPYFPIAWCDERNRFYDVLELGFFTQDMDLGSWADSSIIEPCLAIAKRVEGVAHFLFHQYHILRREEVRAAFRKVVTEARRQGFEFWTADRINAWTRARRQVRIAACESGQVELEGELNGVVVWVPVRSDEQTGSEGLEFKYGVACRKTTAFRKRAVV